MKLFVSILLLVLYAINPVANAAIHTHLQEHHHQHEVLNSEMNDDIISHEHHSHTIVSFETAILRSSNSSSHNKVSLTAEASKTPGYVKYHYNSHKFKFDYFNQGLPPPPDSFRSLPLLI